MDAGLEEHAEWIEYCANVIARKGKPLTAQMLRESLAYLLERIEAREPIPYEVTPEGAAALGVQNEG